MITMLLTLLACFFSFLIGVEVMAWKATAATWRKDDAIDRLEFKNRNLRAQVEWYRAQREDSGEGWKQ
jgi:hypothetical protein